VKLVETPVRGTFVIEIERREDPRGFFARTWCRREFEELGLDPALVQINVGYNLRAGTVRGMHFQRAPFDETKVVRCTRGAVFDVAVDLRPDSPTHRRWTGVELSVDNHRMLYVPRGCAHGYQTLVDDTELVYQTSQVYAPDHATGVRYDDPAFAIVWPMPATVLSEADRSWPDHGKETR
jgi:dTDP-4-dehydrorhamnose 3,5-epimerase